ncbi:peptidylprolyl isomerase [Dokdonia pacifica]|uniref:Periplasmic chaperone for outer membrane proteins SurA n=1 Tax=Dokdonia pacifica TaxID=1627892 RepID=A0A238YRL8_9FLAO|nr:periplasmic chaperone for outer membrane proteins SurA [Dokdonia pacifica]
MMLLKTKNLKFIIKTLVLLFLCQPLFAQDGNTNPKTKFKVDGVAGVVGDYLILESDIDKFLFDIKSQGQSSVDITPCQVMGKLLEDKLLAHHAIQDSIVVNDAQINSEVDQIIDRFAQQLGSIQKVIEYYKKDNIAELRAELFAIRRDIRLSESMNEKIITSVDVTPDEVKSFFESIPEDELPTFGVELEIAQIVIEPKATDEERQRIIDRLNSFRSDILDNGSSFATKAVLYTDDAASRGDGGFMTINRKTPLVKEFRDVVFGLQEGEVSEPFETEYGFHIATLEKIRGDKLEIRHILLIPEVGKAQEEEAKDKIERIKKRIEEGELTFDQAAREFSDEKETKYDGGVLVNPVTLDKRFELNKLDPTLYTKVNNLKDQEVSLVFNDPSRTGKTRYKILTVKNRLEEHKADYSKDYIKIKDLALREKQIKAISEWQKEKIEETYIKVNGDNRDCEYVSNWLKK